MLSHMESLSQAQQKTRCVLALRTALDSIACPEIIDMTGAADGSEDSIIHCDNSQPAASTVLLDTDSASSDLKDAPKNK